MVCLANNTSLNPALASISAKWEAKNILVVTTTITTRKKKRHGNVFNGRWIRR
jgi:hypothetical protein